MLKSIQPDVSIWTVYKGVFPFVVADLVKLVLLLLFPDHYLVAGHDDGKLIAGGIAPRR